MDAGNPEKARNGRPEGLGQARIIGRPMSGSPRHAGCQRDGNSNSTTGTPTRFDAILIPAHFACSRFGSRITHGKFMDRIRIVGGRRLQGTIPISGAKNAALPLMIASLLTQDRLTLKNVPNLADVNLLARILRNHGVDHSVDGKRAGAGQNTGETFHLTARDIVDTTAPYEMVSRMRASLWVLGPLLARMGEAKVSMPGGCAIGTRLVELHLTGLRALGAEVAIDGGYVVARAPKGLRGNRISFPKVSVGATHNVMMAAALAKGETVIENAAREPEVA